MFNAIPASMAVLMTKKKYTDIASFYGYIHSEKNYIADINYIMLLRFSFAKNPKTVFR